MVVRLFIVIGVLSFVPAGNVQAHSNPIEVLADGSQLRVLTRLRSEAFGAVANEQTAPAPIDVPGFVVADGLQVGDVVELRVLGPLLFADGQAGTTLPQSTATLSMTNPRGDFTYDVTAATIANAGMAWMTYGGVRKDQHGLFTLDPGGDPDGVYAVRLRAYVAGYEPSDPFLLLFKTHGFAADLFSTAAYQLLRSVPGDANLDTMVDHADLRIWQDNRFQTLNDWFRGDFNGDSVTDGADFHIWWANRDGAPSDAMVLQVPEPQGLELMGAIALCSAVTCRRRCAHGREVCHLDGRKENV